MKRICIRCYQVIFSKIFSSILFFILAAINSLAQEKVTFYSEDSLKITADLYMKDYNLPFILLFHQGGSSRGEYKDIAPRLQKLEYNCLAVDLRSGDKMNYVNNETATRAQNEKKPHTYLDAQKDIKAAITYIRKTNNQPVILLGSSFSASLCLMVAKNNPKVIAVIAFSPGEYFRPEKVVKDEIAGLTQPIFISATELEDDFISQLISGIPEENRFIFTPSKGKGGHGAKMLWNSNESSDECWLELLLFFKKVRFL
jgi:dienelactone hydrolase